MSHLSALERVRYYGHQAAWMVAGGVFAAAARKSLKVKAKPPPPDEIAIVRKRYRELLADDLNHAAAGHYPASLLGEPSAALLARGIPRLIMDAPRTVRRKLQKNFKDLPIDVELSQYPPYYRRNFHWQTDGYLSRRSAELYDVGVELLFHGSAAIMRRQIIPPVGEEIRRSERALDILDVATGTGAALDGLARAYPHQRYVGVDLSPHYARHAHRRLARRGITVTQGNAEALDFPDASMDVVTSVFLFHELPRSARRNVLREAHRVLRPGGLLVIEDSAQLKDSRAIATILQGFPREFHEPYYQEYLGDPLDELAVECGFEVQSATSVFVSVLVVARKAIA